MFQIVTAVLFFSPGKGFPAENSSLRSAVAEGGQSWVGRFVKRRLAGIRVKMWHSVPAESWELPFFVSLHSVVQT